MKLFPRLKDKFLNSLRDDGYTDEEIDKQLPYMFEEYYARPNQREPECDYYIWLLLAGRGFGKGLDLATELPTPNGFIRIGDVKIGDFIFGGNGKPATVTGISEINNIDCYKIIFDDGSELIADGEHRWVVTTRAARRFASNKNIDVEEIMLNTRQMFPLQEAKDGKTNFAIEVSPQIYSKKWTGTHPFLFGVYLGHCDKNDTKIYDPELLKIVKKNLGSFHGYEIVDGVPVGLRAELLELGVLVKKRIPNRFMFSSANYKKEIISGLIASGAIKLRGKDARYRINDNDLRTDVKTLLCSLGYKVQENGNELNWCYNKSLGSEKVRRRYIKSIEKVNSIPTICISVDSPDNTYLITRSFIKTHNTRTGAEWVRKKVESGSAKRIALVGRTPSDALKVMINGEALSVETDIFTPNGFKKLKNIHAGDYVYGADGLPTKVLWESPVYKNRKCYKVCFTTGDFIIADENHKWLTEDCKSRINRSKGRKNIGENVVTTKYIYDTVKYKNGGHVNNHFVKINKPVVGEEKELFVHPYVLGFWLGDGSKREGSIACVEHLDTLDILKKYYDVLPVQKCGHQYTLKLLVRDLKKYSLLNNKHIPQDYVVSSVAQRIELMRGLMDTDGTVGPNGDCSFTNINYQMITTFREIICSLGIKVGKLMVTKKKGYSDKYRIVFHSGEICPFYAKEKVEKWKERNKNTSRIKNRAICSVECVESVPVKCIAVDNSESLFLAGRAMIPTHNSGIISKSPPWYKPIYNHIHKKLVWPCKCHGNYKCEECPQAHVFSSYLPDEIRGNQFDCAWGDEFASWFKVEETWMQLNMATRLGEQPQILLSTTPRPIKEIKELVKKASAKDYVRDSITNLPTDVMYCIITSGSTYDNKSNLPNQYIQKMHNDYEGTDIGKQELYGEVLEELSGTYWSQGTIDSFRINPEDLEYRDEDGNLLINMSKEQKKLRFIHDNIEKIVIGVDPGFSDGKDAGETGIVVCGIDKDGEAYVIEDASKQYAPIEWAKKISKLYHKHLCDLVIAETNHGQKIVISNISVHDPTVRVRGVNAKRGKKTRAQPISTLYEQGKVHHLGSQKDFEKLEEQMVTWTEDGTSPDRIDALVWALTYLMVDYLYYGKLEASVIERDLGESSIENIGLFGNVENSLWDDGGREPKTFWS